MNKVLLKGNFYFKDRLNIFPYISEDGKKHRFASFGICIGNNTKNIASIKQNGIFNVSDVKNKFSFFDISFEEHKKKRNIINIKVFNDVLVDELEKLEKNSVIEVKGSIESYKDRYYVNANQISKI